MKIVHTSDIHGHFGSLIDQIPECDLILDTGDFLPNNRRGPEDIGFQKDWIFKKRGGLSRLVKKARLGVIAVRGNHDWASVDDLVDGWRTLDHEMITAEGLRIYGMPGVPWMGGDWNTEMGPETLSFNAAAAFAEPCDVLLTHCPPHGILDWTGREHIGNPALRDALDYGHNLPKYLLAGHVHEQGGASYKHQHTTIHNGAQRITTFHISPPTYDARIE